MVERIGHYIFSSLLCNYNDPFEFMSHGQHIKEDNNGTRRTIWNTRASHAVTWKAVSTLTPE